MRRNKGIVVVGAQWGDEGKGKLVDVLATRADWVVRYQGGANAGHTVEHKEEFKLHQIPSGILHPGVMCGLGNGVVLDGDECCKEIDALVARGIDVDGRVWVDNRAHLLFPFHKALDKAYEALKKRQGKEIGTTGRGIGLAYEDKVARRGIQVAEIRNWNSFMERVNAAVERANNILKSIGGAPLDPKDAEAEMFNIARRVIKMATDIGERLDEALSQGKKVLLEGAQGTFLDVDHGTYPYVTSSNTVAGNAAVGTGLGPTDIGRVIIVAKAYTTRVGNGPLPTELFGEEQEHMRSVGDEFGATTGRPRRCGWFDVPVVRRAARLNGATELAITKLDILDGYKKIKICVGYEGGCFPRNAEEMAKVKPIYETLPGWRKPTSDIRSWDDLPRNARRYLRRIEKLVGVKIKFISVGKNRKEVIRIGRKRRKALQSA